MSKSVESTIQAIRTIAKTKEIEEKADKALKKSQLARREQIQAERAQTRQSSDSGDSTAKTDEGEPVEAPSSSTQANTTTQTPNDSTVSSIDSFNMSLNGGLTQFGNNSNLAGFGSTGGANSAPLTGGSSIQGNLRGGGGSLNTEEFNNRVSDINARLEAIQARGEAKGESQQEINRQKSREIYEFSASTPDSPKGVYRIGDLFHDGTIWPSEGSGDGITGAPGSPKINMLIGDYEVGENILTVGIPLRETLESELVPIQADLDFAIQSEWADRNTPGYDGGFTPGRVWYRTELGFRQTFRELLSLSFPSQVWLAVSEDDFNLIVRNPPLPGDRLRWVNSENSPTGVGEIASGGTGFPFHPYDPDRTSPLVGYGQIKCGNHAGANEVCALPPPLAQAYPQTGTIILEYVNGQLTFNSYDSEVPNSLRHPTSTITLKDAGINYQLGPTWKGGWYVTLADEGPILPVSGQPTPAILIRPDATIEKIIPKGYLSFYTPDSGLFE